VTRAERLDLGAAQRDAGLEAAFDLVVEVGLAVLGELDLAHGFDRSRVGLSGGHRAQIRR
jgi:hypothetical protein